MYNTISLFSQPYYNPCSQCYYNIITNINLLYSYLLQLSTNSEGRKYINKIDIMKNEIEKLNTNITRSSINASLPTDSVFASIIAIITPKICNDLLIYIEEGIQLMNKLYIFIDLNKEITELPPKTADTLCKQIIEKSFSSAIDPSSPDTAKLGLDYKNLLSAYYIQRGYFSNLKQGSIGCNSPAIIDALSLITETIKFLFDDVEQNIITKSMLNQPFIGTGNIPNAPAEEVTINSDLIFESELNKNQEVLVWINESDGNEPGILARLTPFLLALPIDFNHFKKIDKLSFKNINGFAFYIVFKNASELDSEKTNIKTSITNLIKRLYLISKLNKIFKFLDLITFDLISNPQGTKKILDINSTSSLISYFDDILWKEYDKITYINEFEKLFNFKILFDLVIKYGSITDAERIPKYIELSEAKKVWTDNNCKKYGDLWKSVADKIVPMYLLNVKQGFWINHSIRFFMRTTMYTSDKIWIENQLFDEPPLEIEQSKTNLINMGKEDTIKLLLPYIILLADFVNENQDRKLLTAEIFSNKKTLENLALTKYDIRKSPWLKLLATLHHLGSNINPTDIIIKLPKSTTKTTNTTTRKWTVEELKPYFFELNKQYMKGKINGGTEEENNFVKNENAELFLTALYDNTDLPDIINFKDTDYKEIFNKYLHFLEPDSIDKLRFPWKPRGLEPDEKLTIKNKLDDDKLKNLFKYYVYENGVIKTNVSGNKIEITKEKIEELNDKIKKHNEVVGTRAQSITQIETEIDSYKEQVKKFNDALNQPDYDQRISTTIFNSFREVPVPVVGGSNRYYQNKNNLSFQRGGDLTEYKNGIEAIYKNNGTDKPPETAPQDTIDGITGYRLEIVNQKLLEKLKEALDETSDTEIKPDSEKLDLLYTILKNRGTNLLILYKTKELVKEICTILNDKIAEFNTKLGDSIEAIKTENNIDNIKTQIDFFDKSDKLRNIYVNLEKMLFDKYIMEMDKLSKEKRKKTNLGGAPPTLITILNDVLANFKNGVNLKTQIEIFTEIIPKKDADDKILYQKLFDLNIEKINNELNETKIKIDALKISTPVYLENELNRNRKGKYDSFIQRISLKYESFINEINKNIKELDDSQKKFGVKTATSTITINKNKTEQNIIKAKLIIINLHYVYITKLALNESEVITEITVIIDEIKKIKNLFKDIESSILANITEDEQAIITREEDDISNILITKQNIITVKEAEQRRIIEEREAEEQRNLAESNAARQLFQQNNQAKIDNFNNKLAEELKVKNKLKLTYTDIKSYRDVYNPLKDTLLRNFVVKQGNSVEPTVLEAISDISEVSLANLNQNFSTVLDEVKSNIIESINQYVNINAFFPNIEDRVKFDSLVDEIYNKIQSKVYNKLKQEEIKIISKKENLPENILNKEFSTKIYDQGIKDYMDLKNKLDTDKQDLADKISERNEKWIAFLSNLSNTIEVKAALESGFQELKHQNKTYYIKEKTQFSGKGSQARIITENTIYEDKKNKINQAIDTYVSDQQVIVIENKIMEYENKINEYKKKIEIYKKYFTKNPPTEGSSVAPWTDDDFKAVDEITKRLSNIYYVENFKTTPINSYSIDVKPSEADVKTIITSILTSITINRATKREDPLATLRLSSGKVLNKDITIEELKLSKLVNSLQDTTDTEFSISSSRTLLLAISTRPDKVELVIASLYFAMLLSIITNPRCEENIISTEKTQQVGGFKKYKIIKNDILQQMTGGLTNKNKIIYLDEIDEKKEIQKKYKIIKLNK